MNRSMTATLKNAETSDKKIALIAKMVRGKDVLEARNILQFMPKKAAKILLKVIESAAHNAEHNANESVDNLFIKTIEVGRATKLKRMRFVGRSRVHRYTKHRANITVILAIK